MWETECELFEFVHIQLYSVVKYMSCVTFIRYNIIIVYYTTQSNNKELEVFVLFCLVYSYTQSPVDGFILLNIYIYCTKIYINFKNTCCVFTCYCKHIDCTCLI